MRPSIRTLLVGLLLGGLLTARPPRAGAQPVTPTPTPTPSPSPSPDAEDAPAPPGEAAPEAPPATAPAAPLSLKVLRVHFRGNRKVEDEAIKVNLRTQP